MDNKQLLEIDPILKGKGEISIRLVDWFVTNYSKKNKVIIDKVKVYESYKLQLRDLSKKNFDPFCRWNKIQLKIGDINIITSNSQVTFFKWAIHNKIIDYIRKNHHKLLLDI